MFSRIIAIKVWITRGKDPGNRQHQVTVVRGDDKKRGASARTDVVYFAEYRRGRSYVRAVKQCTAHHAGGERPSVLTQMGQPDFHQTFWFFLHRVAFDARTRGHLDDFLRAGIEVGHIPHAHCGAEILVGFQGTVLAAMVDGSA